MQIENFKPLEVRVMSRSGTRLSVLLEESSSRLVIDDEHERSIRRDQAEFQRRLTNLLTQSPLPNDEEVKEHFNICLKMFTENKISVKNAWSLKMIDYLRTVLISKIQEKETLQVAGTSLEAGTKIYVIRVDDVHSNTLKLAGNMSKTSVQKTNQDVEPDAQNTQSNNKRARRHERVTVSQDPKTLIGELPKVQSTFFCTPKDTDLVATNLLSSTLLMHYTGYKFMLLSKDAAWINYEEKFKVIKKKEYATYINTVGKIQLCSAFQDFEIDQWNLEDEASLENVGENTVVYNELSVPIPELDGSIPNIFEIDVEDLNNNKEEISPVQETEKIKRNDYFYCKLGYNYGNKRISRLWTGPSYWRLKYIKRNVSRFSGKTKRGKRRVVKKFTPQPVNFLDEINPMDKTKFCKRKLVSTDADYVKCTLPERFLFESEVDRPLILKPLYTCKNSSDVLKECVVDVTVSNDEESSINYEQSFENVFENASVHEEIVCGNQREFQQENLIDVPQMAQNLHIQYATKAKRMDMKKLKKSIWKTLTNHDDLDKTSEEVKKRKFSEVYEETPKHLSKKYKDQLSCPLTFVALLHLANEKNLNFTKVNNENDFFIEKKDTFE